MDLLKGWFTEVNELQAEAAYPGTLVPFYRALWNVGMSTNSGHASGDAQRRKVQWHRLTR
jgi:hypothetical protein